MLAVSSAYTKSSPSSISEQPFLKRGGKPFIFCLICSSRIRSLYLYNVFKKKNNTLCFIIYNNHTIFVIYFAIKIYSFIIPHVKIVRRVCLTKVDQINAVAPDAAM